MVVGYHHFRKPPHIFIHIRSKKNSHLKEIVFSMFPPWTAATLSPFLADSGTGTPPETSASFSPENQGPYRTPVEEMNLTWQSQIFYFSGVEMLHLHILDHFRSWNSGTVYRSISQEKGDRRTPDERIRFHLVIHQIHPSIVIMCHPRSMIPNWLARVLSQPKSSKHNPKISHIWMMVIWCHFQVVATLRDSNPSFPALLCLRKSYGAL